MGRQPLPQPKPYQEPADRPIKRLDHVWLRKHLDPASGKMKWKCVLCGAITYGEPPVFPTHSTFEPVAYEPLTPQERNLCPKHW